MLPKTIYNKQLKPVKQNVPRITRWPKK